MSSKYRTLSIPQAIYNALADRAASQGAKTADVGQRILCDALGLDWAVVRPGRGPTSRLPYDSRLTGRILRSLLESGAVPAEVILAAQAEVQARKNGHTAQTP